MILPFRKKIWNIGMHECLEYLHSFHVLRISTIIRSLICTNRLGIVYNYQCFKKKNNVLLCGWVGQSEKSMFLVFFSLNPDIPWYVSCLENIHFMLKNIHFICSHDIKFKYKNVFTMKAA